jgi:hypothetical protein
LFLEEEKYFQQAHVYAGCPPDVPTEHFVRGVLEIVVALLKKYEALGHELRGRNLTVDR